MSLNSLTPYEIGQLAGIKEWKAKEPGIVSQTVGVVTYPLTWLVQKIIPNAAIRGVLNVANWTGSCLADTGDIIRDGQVQKISDLKTGKLEVCDVLADSVHNWAIGIAVTEGSITGATGLPGLIADIPTIITLALRTIHKVGLCYGYECSCELDNNFILSVLSASSANSMKEKVGALMMLQSIKVALVKQTWKVIIEKGTAHQVSKEGAIIAFKNLAKQVGINLTKRKALQAIPLIGAGVGASVNGQYINDVSWAARRNFQERWLVDNGKLTEI